jgi:hypothetical protein
MLPHGPKGSNGKPAGVQPDGISFSHDGRYAVTANEAKSNAKHLAGISVLDLREAPEHISAGPTYCIYDLDTTLLDSTGLTACPVPGPSGEYPSDANKLPRLDPEDTALLRTGGSTVLAVVLERNAKDEDRGSLLFLDATGILEGRVPVKIDRKLVGHNAGARPETVVATRDGRYFFSAIESDGGTLARVGVTRQE